VILLKAEQMGIRVGEEDVRELILTYPAFQRNGAFDQRIYEQMLRANKMTPEEFEDLQRKVLTAMRVEDLIRDGVIVSDREVRDLFQMQREKLNVEFIALDPKAFQAGIRVGDAELEAYLKSHENQFRVPEQVEVRYLAFLGQDYAATAKASEDDVAEYYERRKAQWQTKDGKVQPLSEVRDRIVAELKIANGMYAAADEAKKAHDTIYQNENFDAYAAQKGLTVRSTGLFRISEPPPEFRPVPDFAKILSGLQKNETSRVLKGERGYYLITVAQRKPSYLPALKEIEALVERQYREEEGRRLAQKEAEALLARLKKGEALEAVAREKGLKINETGLFQPGGAVPKLGASAELMEALFQISEKKPYPEKSYAVDNQYVIVKFKARGKVNDEEFAAQKEQVTKYLVQQKKAEAVQAWIEASKAALVKEGRLTYTRDLKDL
jgi:peptidyl-prolyl cis-trans isomerase D